MAALKPYKMDAVVFASDALALFLKIDELCANISKYLIDSGIAEKSSALGKAGKKAETELAALIQAKQDLIDLQHEIQPAALEKLRASSFKDLFNGGRIDVPGMLTRFEELTKRYKRDKERFKLTITELETNLSSAQAAAGKVPNLQSEKDDLQRRLDDAQAKLSASPKSLKKDTDAITRLEADLAAVRGELAAAQAKITKKDEELKRLAESMAKSGGAATELAKAQADLTRIRA
jgi:chromosome segregation ATPase